MNAIPSAIPESKAAEQRAHEPSMEEILASIRKIISDDQPLPLSLRDEPEPEVLPIEAEVEAVIEAEVLKTRPVLRAPEPEIERLRPPMPPRPTFDAPRDVTRDAPRETPREPSREIARFEPPPPRPVRPMAEVRDFAPRAPAAAPPTVPRLVPEPEETPAPLLSDRANTSVSAAFKALGAARALPNPEMLEQAAREMMRPMLKQWLDENLPSMVESLVKSEIERITRGG